MKINFMQKYLILALLLISNLSYSQVIETGSSKNSFFKVYSSDVKFIEIYKNTKEFIHELDTNLLSYIKDDKLEKKVFNFYYNGDYKGIKYLSHYLISKINSKALSLNSKDKLKICNIINKYDKDSPSGYNCIADLNYQNSKITFWNYLIPYTKAYVKYIQNDKNTNLFFYSTFYFLIFFFIIIILLSFIKASGLFIKDIYSLFLIKRQHYESIFWAVSIFMLGIYISSFNLLLLVLLIVSLSFAYLKKIFIPLYILLLLLPLGLSILIEEYQSFDIKLSPSDNLAMELIHTDILPSKNQLYSLKRNKSFFSNIAIALNYKKNFNYKTSLKYYKDALKIKKMGFIYNNIANIHAIIGQKEKAISSYNEAKYYNDEAIYFYNLSKLYYRHKDKERAQYSRKLANNIDKNLVKEFDKISSFNPNRFYLDKFPEYKESLKIYKKLSKPEDKDKYLNQFQIDNKKYFVDLSISVLFFILLTFIFRKKLSAAYCQRCGILFNNLDITVKHKSFDLCAQCHSMMNARSSLKKEDLMKKEKEIRLKKKLIKIRDIILNFMLPGSFLFYKNDSYLGVLLILWQSYYVIVVITFYNKWKIIVNENFFNFSTIIFAIISISIYIYTFYKLKTRS